MVERSWGKSTKRVSYGCSRTPNSAANRCNSQVPFLPQVKHEFGWVDMIISMTVLRTWYSSASWVITLRFSWTGAAQARNSFGEFSCFTIHKPQAAHAGRSGW